MKNEELQELYDGAISKNKENTGKMNLLCNKLYTEVNRLESELEDKEEELERMKDACVTAVNDRSEVLRNLVTVGSEFWELNTIGILPMIYPRIAHSESHVEYFWEKYNTVTFLTERDAKRALKSYLKNHPPKLDDDINKNLKTILTAGSDPISHYAAVYIAALESIVESIA